jgi:uncharacterized membrane protein YdjX (TVP38/TMEM64 family)
MFCLQVSAVIIIHMTWQLWVLTVVLVVGGALLFYLMMYVGERLVQKQIEKEKMVARDREILSFNGHINSVLNIGE